MIPKARGGAARLVEEAAGYRERAIATAEGDASRFRQVLAEYSRAPQVTRERMYLETMQRVFANTSKVYVDSRGGSNLLYLPLDQLIRGAGDGQARTGQSQQAAPPAPEAAAGADAARTRDSLRSRDRDVSR